MRWIFTGVILWLCVFFGLIFLPSWARAEPPSWQVQLHGISFHPEGAGWNEKNWGLGVRYVVDDSWSVQAGFYKNSYSRRSEYLLAQWQPLQVAGVQVGVFAGYLSGYRLRYPLGAGLMATLPVAPRLQLGLRHIPKVGQAYTSVTAVEVGISF